MKPALTVACLTLAAAGPAFAQAPKTTNAKVVTQPAQPDLAGAIGTLEARQTEPIWIGYSVPIFDRGVSRGGDGWSERCRLEQTPGDPGAAPAAIGPIRLEPSRFVMVLLRVQNREIQTVRSFSTDCVIDAGGLSLYWLDKVDPVGSVGFLKNQVVASTNQSRVDGPLAAIAQHADRAAIGVLLDFAKNGPSTQIRRRAMFWVAHRAEAQAVPAITDTIEKDPDVEVKKQAVFALSTMPPDQSTPLLIKLATSNPNPAVRKQAMFWLGQSRDPRALAFFEQLLR